jgi:hypothetical protein
MVEVAHPHFLDPLVLRDPNYFSSSISYPLKLPHASAFSVRTYILNQRYLTYFPLNGLYRHRHLRFWLPQQWYLFNVDYIFHASL